MKKLMIICSIFLALSLTACKSIEACGPETIELDKDQLYSSVNTFINTVKDQDYISAMQYYKDSDRYEPIAFSSFVKSTSLGKALDNGTISYTLQSYDCESGIAKLSFIYDDDRHYMTVDVNDGYKIFISEEEIIHD